MSAPVGAPSIRHALPADTAQIRAIAQAAYRKYVPRLGREPAPMSADLEAHVAAPHLVHGDALFRGGAPRRDAFGKAIINDEAIRERGRR